MELYFVILCGLLLHLTARFTYGVSRLRTSFPFLTKYSATSVHKLNLFYNFGEDGHGHICHWYKVYKWKQNSVKKLWIKLLTKRSILESRYHCNIASYGYTTFYLSIDQFMDTCFYFWVVMNSAAVVNIHVQVLHMDVLRFSMWNLYVI